MQPPRRPKRPDLHHIEGHIATTRKGQTRRLFLSGRSSTLAGINPANKVELRQWRLAVRYWQGKLRAQLGNHMRRFNIPRHTRELVYAFGHNFLLQRRPPNDPIAPNGFRTPTIAEFRKVFPFLGQIHTAPPKIIE